MCSTKGNLKRHLETQHEDLAATVQLTEAQAQEREELEQMFENGDLSMTEFEELMSDGNYGQATKVPYLNLGKLMAHGAPEKESSYSTEYYPEFCQLLAVSKVDLTPALASKNYWSVVDAVLKDNISCDATRKFVTFLGASGQLIQKPLTLALCKRLYTSIVQAVCFNVNVLFRKLKEAGDIEDGSQGYWVDQIVTTNKILQDNCRDKAMPHIIKTLVKQHCIHKLIKPK